MNLPTEAGAEASLQKTTNKFIQAQSEVKASLTLTAVTTRLSKRWWLIGSYLVVAVLGAAIGAFLSGWISFIFAISIEIITTYIGFYAFMKVVREVTRDACGANQGCIDHRERQ